MVLVVSRHELSRGDGMPIQRGLDDDHWRRVGQAHAEGAGHAMDEANQAIVRGLLAIHCELRHQAESGEAMGQLSQALRGHASAMEEFGPGSRRG